MPLTEMSAEQMCDLVDMAARSLDAIWISRHKWDGSGATITFNDGRDVKFHPLHNPANAFGLITFHRMSVSYPDEFTVCVDGEFVEPIDQSRYCTNGLCVAATRAAAARHRRRIVAAKEAG